MKKVPLSVVILNKNEASHLRELLPTLKFANEIVCIDDNSTDESKSVVERYGGKVYLWPLNDNFAAARNYGLKKATNLWVLFIDADERLSPELVREISQKVRQENQINGYKIKRRDIFLGKKLKYGETGGLSLVRLGKKDAGIWERPVHERWVIKGTPRLEHELIHYAHNSSSDLRDKVEKYAKIEADFRKNESGLKVIGEWLVYPYLKFIKTYFWQMGFLDGYPGFLMSFWMSYHSFRVRQNILGRYLPLALSRRQRMLLILNAGIAAAYVFGQLGRWQFGQGPKIYFFEGLMAGIITIELGSLFRNHNIWSIPKFGVYGAILMVSLGLSWFMNWSIFGSQALSMLLYWIRLLIYGLWTVSVWNLSRQIKGQIKLERILVGAGIGLLFTGLLQYLLMPDLRWLFWFGFDEHYFRLVGSVLDPGFMSLLLGLGLVLVLFEKVKYQGMWLVLFSLGLALTFARSGYLIYGLTVLWFGWVTNNWKKAGLIISLFLVMVYFIPKPGGEGVNLGRTFSVVSRVESVSKAMDIFRKKPIWGIGFNNYPLLRDDNNDFIPTHSNSPDNSFVFVLVTAGLVGFCSFIFYIQALYYELRKFPTGYVSLTIILIHSFTNNSFFYPMVMVWLGWLIALGVQKRVRDNNGQLNSG